MGLCLGKHAGKQTRKEELAAKQLAQTADKACVNGRGDKSNIAASQAAVCCQQDQQASSHTGVQEGSAAELISSTAVHQQSNEAEPLSCAAQPTASALMDAASGSLPTGCPGVNGVGTRPTTSSESAAGTAARPMQTAFVQASKAQANGNAAPHIVKFADPALDSAVQLPPSVDCPTSLSAGGVNGTRHGLPRRSRTFASQGSISNDEGRPCAAVLAQQVKVLCSNKMEKLKKRHGGLDISFQALQDALEQNEEPLAHVNTRAAGLKHIGFGPFKRENQDEFFIQVGNFGKQHSSNLFCVFDGHGSHGKDAAYHSRQLLPRLLDAELGYHLERVDAESDEGLKGAVELLLTEVFGETERSVLQFGVNLANSGTTACVAYQLGNRLWVASAGDSRTILCSRDTHDEWRAVPLTLDHRPRRTSERERVQAAGARVAPKRLPSGRSVGEPRLWLQNAHGPGLMLSRSLGDLRAATVGCTSDPEVSYTTLRPGVDHVLVMATDGVWDVLTNEQVCDIVVESPDPHLACRRVLDAALYEWEERMSADNITVLVVEFDWGEEGSHSAASMELLHAGGNAIRSDQQASRAFSDVHASVTAMA